jgi:Lipocalin-like domain
VAAQLVRKDRRRFVSEDWEEAANSEAATAWKEYFGYFGTYSVDLNQHAVIHHVEGSWFPNLLGSDQVRHFRFEGRRLILDADTKWGTRQYYLGASRWSQS